MDITTARQQSKYGRRHPHIKCSPGIIGGTALAVFLYSVVTGLSMSAIFFVGLAQTFHNTIGGVLLQTYTEYAYMGRVMNIFNMQWGRMSACTFLAGVLAEKISARYILGTLSILLVIPSVGFPAGFKNVRPVK